MQVTQKSMIDAACITGSPIRVLYVVPPSAHFAGIERVTDEIATALSSGNGNAFEICVLYFKKYPEVTLPVYRAIYADAARVREIPIELQKVLRQENFDIIIIPQFEIAAVCLLIIRLFGRKARIILHLHGNPEVERLVSFKSRIAFSFFRRVTPLFDGVIAVSPGLAKHVRTMAPVEVVHLPNPVRQLGEQALVDDTRLLGRQLISVGRLAFQKGHDLTIRAFRIVLDRFPDAKLTILGEGPARAELESLIVQLGLEKAVSLKGMVPNPAFELAQASVFVSSSRWEGFGVAIVEALSVGLPVISTRCDFGPEDLITSDALGILVEPNSPDLLADAITRHFQAPPLRGGIGLRRARAAESSRDVVVDSHAAYLLQLALRV